MATITSEAWTNQSPKNVNTYPHTYLLSSKTMRGSLFPLLPLRMKCQNHERVPISPILVVHALSSCQDMGHQNRGNRDPFMVLALHQGKTQRGSLFPLFPLRVKCQNHERVPISPISPILVVHALSSCQDMGHQNRGNRDPFMVLALHQGKTLRGSPGTLSVFSLDEVPKPWKGPYFPYFPYFGGPCLGKMKR